MLVYVFLVLGFFFLVKGADLLVDGASSLAKRLNISNLTIGLTIVAFGTTTPELVINVISSLKGSADLALGNVIGSNISNILLIGGVAAMVYPIVIRKGTVWKQIHLSIIAILLLLLLGNDFLIDRMAVSVLGRIDGILLIGFFLIFLYYTFGAYKLEVKDESDYDVYGLETSILYVIIGIAGLIIGGKWIIDSVLKIAVIFNLSESLIGLTVLAVGTSLPELATATVATFKKNADLAIGNIIGSNIFNIFFITGVSALIRPLKFNPMLNIDLLICIGATLLLYLFVFIGRKDRQIERWEGIGLFCAYLLYIVFLVWRG